MVATVEKKPGKRERDDKLYIHAIGTHKYECTIDFNIYYRYIHVLIWRFGHKYMNMYMNMILNTSCMVRY